MYEDPIVNEVRKTRERLMDEAGGYDAYIRKLKGMEEKHSERQATGKLSDRKALLDAAEA
jgi:hypothetical protein